LQLLHKRTLFLKNSSSGTLDLISFYFILQRNILQKLFGHDFSKKKKSKIKKSKNQGNVSEGNKKINSN